MAFERLNNESLLTTYLLIQKDLTDIYLNEDDEKLFYTLSNKSKELKDEILRRMENGRREKRND